MIDTPDLAELGITLTGLISVVDEAVPGADDALSRLPLAVAVSEQLDELGDHLVGHYVDQARQAGASWTAIGASMGVTKQAAQKKFFPGAGDVPHGRPFSRFTPRAATTVEVARQEAGRMHSAAVGTEHLVLGLVAAGGLAVEVLRALGLTDERIRAAVQAAAPPAVEDGPERVPFAATTKRALEVAVREALRRGHNYIGTEHLLLAVLADTESTGGRVLGSLGIDAAAAAAKVDETLAEFMAAKGM